MNEANMDGGFLKLRNPPPGVFERESEFISKRNDLQVRLGLNIGEFEYFKIRFASYLEKKDPDINRDEEREHYFEEMCEIVMSKNHLTHSVVDSITRMSNMLTSLIVEQEKENGGINLFSSKLFKNDASEGTISHFKKEIAEARSRKEEPQLTRAQEKWKKELEMLREMAAQNSQR